MNQLGPNLMTVDIGANVKICVVLRPLQFPGEPPLQLQHFYHSNMNDSNLNRSTDDTLTPNNPNSKETEYSNLIFDDSF